MKVFILACLAASVACHGGGGGYGGGGHHGYGGGGYGGYRGGGHDGYGGSGHGGYGGSGHSGYGGSGHGGYGGSGHGGYGGSGHGGYGEYSHGRYGGDFHGSYDGSDHGGHRDSYERSSGHRFEGHSDQADWSHDSHEKTHGSGSHDGSNSVEQTWSHSNKHSGEQHGSQFESVGFHDHKNSHMSSGVKDEHIILVQKPIYHQAQFVEESVISSNENSHGNKHSGEYHGSQLTTHGHHDQMKSNSVKDEQILLIQKPIHHHSQFVEESIFSSNGNNHGSKHSGEHHDSQISTHGHHDQINSNSNKDEQIMLVQKPIIHHSHFVEESIFSSNGNDHDSKHSGEHHDSQITTQTNSNSNKDEQIMLVQKPIHHDSQFVEEFTISSSGNDHGTKHNNENHVSQITTHGHNGQMNSNSIKDEQIMLVQKPIHHDSQIVEEFTISSNGNDHGSKHSVEHHGSHITTHSTSNQMNSNSIKDEQIILDQKPIHHQSQFIEESIFSSNGNDHSIKQSGEHHGSQITTDQHEQNAHSIKDEQMILVQKPIQLHSQFVDQSIFKGDKYVQNPSKDVVVEHVHIIQTKPTHAGSSSSHKTSYDHQEETSFGNFQEPSNGHEVQHVHIIQTGPADKGSSSHQTGYGHHQETSYEYVQQPSNEHLVKHIHTIQTDPITGHDHKQESSFGFVHQPSKIRVVEQEVVIPEGHNLNVLSEHKSGHNQHETSYGSKIHSGKLVSTTIENGGSGYGKGVGQNEQSIILEEQTPFKSVKH